MAPLWKALCWVLLLKGPHPLEDGEPIDPRLYEAAVELGAELELAARPEWPQSRQESLFWWCKGEAVNWVAKAWRDNVSLPPLALAECLPRHAWILEGIRQNQKRREWLCYCKDDLTDWQPGEQEKALAPLRAAESFWSHAELARRATASPLDRRNALASLEALVGVEGLRTGLWPWPVP